MLSRFLALFLLLAGSSAQADPALWVAHGPHATVYLFGSVRLLRAGTDWQGSALRRAYEKATECWFEVAVPDDSATARLQDGLIGFDFKHKISALLPAEEYARLEAVVQRAKTTADMEVLEMMRPWVVALTLEEALRLNPGYTLALGPVAVLRRQAKADGKTVEGFEPIGMQLHLLADLPQDLAAQLLNFTLDNIEASPMMLDNVVRDWLAGDFEATAAMIEGKMQTNAPMLYKLIVSDRSMRFAEAIEKLLTGNKTVFVTIGAAHLAGSGNVQELLQQRGFTVERVAD